MDVQRGTPGDHITPSVEDYLKAIYALQRDGQVSTMLLTEHMGLKPSSITSMLKKLAELDLVSYTPYHGARLTPAGERVALAVLRHHRLLELFLVQVLGYSWDEVHEEAEALEHHISEKLEARIAAYLGHPQFDPHGDPIPTLDGALPLSPDRRLADVPVGSCGQVVRVCSQQPEELRYLAEVGVVPGAQLEVVNVGPFAGPISIRIAEREHALAQHMAQAICVELM
jgi:DtxR family transcriptional regulator, Mn-dependent transcriptional regulator